jgi:hypothetical protein
MIAAHDRRLDSEFPAKTALVFRSRRGPVLVVIMMYECARSGASLLIQRLVEV